MDTEPSELTPWTEKELRLVNHVEIFQNKPGILKKVEKRFIALQKALEIEVTKLSEDLPESLDLVRNQIAKGENHNGFPYLSLDYPQNFSKTEMFTMRTLFWWGHYLGFSIILKGEKLKKYVDNLLANKNEKNLNEIYVSLAPNPFEWELNDTNFSLVSKAPTQEFQKTILELNYLKLIRVFPVTDEEFMTLDWTNAGLQFWQDLEPLILEK